MHSWLHASDRARQPDAVLEQSPESHLHWILSPADGRFEGDLSQDLNRADDVRAEILAHSGRRTPESLTTISELGALRMDQGDLVGAHGGCSGAVRGAVGVYVAHSG